MSLTLQTILRASATVLLTLSVITFFTVFGKAAFMRSPFLTVNAVIVFSYHIVRLWRHHASEVKSVLYYSVISLGTYLLHIRREYLSIDNQTQRKRRNRRLVRCTVLFVMVNHCLVPLHRLAWLYSVVAYKFVLDIDLFVRREIRAYEQANVDANMDSNSNIDNNAGQRTRRSSLSRPLVITMQFVRGGFILNVFIYQSLYMDRSYFCSTLLYFALNQHCLDKPCTDILEFFQIDLFEGLERLYIRAALGLLEITYAFIFMIWSLVSYQHWLMLAALYTNVYTAIRDVASTAVAAAVKEWILLAKFARATTEELAQLDDICAICLCRMKAARKTPCHHFFHGRCLRSCIKQKPLCPICNTHLLRS